MCDYSMHSVASRLARVGDKLITKSFTTTTRGFAAVEHPKVAICLLPGTELAFEKDVEWYRPFKMFRRKEHLGKLGRFRQINLEKRHAHHDAIEFPSGKVILLTLLCERQRAKVLQLPPPSQAIQRIAFPDSESRAGFESELAAVYLDPWLPGY
ncbi:MAG TPA: hypothetical protein VMU69_04940 [Bradyrhizobium sp.]|nr:hypothetical protein [Bradyrhizobium sp.]